jgi:hypothetical protein
MLLPPSPTHLQELPLLEAELEVRPDLSGHLEADSKKPLDLKHKVRAVCNIMSSLEKKTYDIVPDVVGACCALSGACARHVYTALSSAEPCCAALRVMHGH